MVDKLKKNLRKFGVPEETLNNPSFEVIFSELVELYNRFGEENIRIIPEDFYYQILFENDDDLVICDAEYDRDNNRFHLKIVGGKSITIITNNNEIVKSTAEKVDDIETVESSIFSMSDGLEKKYFKESTGYKDGVPYTADTQVVRMDNGYIAKIIKAESPDAKLGGFVNIDLSSPLLLDSNCERFTDASLLSGETVREGISIPADSTMLEEAKNAIAARLASKVDEEDWKNCYKAGLAYNTFSQDETRGL